MEYLRGIRCPRCGYEDDGAKAFEGCPVCREEGVSVNFSTCYEYGDRETARSRYYAEKGPGIWRHRAFLPVKSGTAPVSIAEGNTPLLHAGRLGKELGLSNLYLKLEMQNTTWSHKDRLSSVGVTRAVQIGASAVTVSSTGNHGAAVAAYAAAAGLPCFIFTKAAVPDTMKTLMRVYGAYVFATEKSLDRWEIMRWGVENLGWYPLSGYVAPAIGSNCYALDGYKSLAFELFDEMGELPDTIVVPSAYSDALYGIWKGVLDLNEIGLTSKKSRMIAAESWGSLKETLAQKAEAPLEVKSGPTVNFSIGGGRNTWQGLHAIRQSGGTAETSGDEETMRMQQLLAKWEGVYAEAASVTPLVVCQKLLAQGKISPDERVVAVISSSGLKDPAETSRRLPEVPVIEPHSRSLSAALERCYGKKLL